MQNITEEDFTAPASILLITSAFIHALWNAIAKKSPQPSILVWGGLTFAAVFALFCIPFFPEESFANPESFFWGIGSGIFEGAYMMTLALTLDRSPLGASYTIMRGGAMLVVWTISSIVLKEKISLLMGLGILAVITGLALTAFSSRQSTNNRGSKKLSGWVYVCALGIAGYHLCYGQSLEHGANPAALFALSMWIAVPALFVFYGRKQLPLLLATFQTRGWQMAIAGFLATTSFILFLIGLKHSGAGFALTLRNTSVVFAQVFGLAIGEKIEGKQWLGAIFVVIGAGLVDSAI